MKYDYADDMMDDDLQAEAVDEALRHFKNSVDAWSEAAYSRERTARIVRKRSWKLAAGWALGCALAAGSISSAIYEQRQSQERARQAEAARAAEQQRLSLLPETGQQSPRPDAGRDQAGQDGEDLLAKVDSDVSQTVPSAMEPLAQLMAEDASQ